jgi:hypothetical protein
MALVTIPGGLYIPAPLTSESQYGNGSILNALNDLEAAAFQAPKTGNLRRFECRFNTVATAPGSGLRFSFQANSGGVNSGTPLSFVQSAGGTPAAAGWFNPGDFDVDIAVTKGDIIFAVIDCSTYTTGSVTSNNFEWANNGWGEYPYGLSNATRNSAGFLNIALFYDDGTCEMVVPSFWPAASHTAVAINTGTTPDEYGNAFQPTFPCRITGIWVELTLANQATSLFDLVVYDSGGSVLMTLSRPASTGLDVGPGYWFFQLDNFITLGAGDLIRATILPTAAVNVSVANVIFNASTEFDCADGGTMLYATQRTNAGAL